MSLEPAGTLPEALLALDDLRGGLTNADANLLMARVLRDNSGRVASILADAFAMGVNVALNVSQGRQTCRICGCWELAACPPTCSWVEIDLCSSCALR